MTHLVTTLEMMETWHTAVLARDVIALQSVERHLARVSLGFEEMEMLLNTTVSQMLVNVEDVLKTEKEAKELEEGEFLLESQFDMVWRIKNRKLVSAFLFLQLLYDGVPDSVERILKQTTSAKQRSQIMTCVGTQLTEDLSSLYQDTNRWMGMLADLFKELEEENG